MTCPTPYAAIWQLNNCPQCGGDPRLHALADIGRARRFANTVLEGDTHGCENGPNKCLHADARRFLDSIGVCE